MKHFLVLVFILVSLAAQAQVKIGLGNRNRDNSTSQEKKDEVNYSAAKDFTIADITITGVEYLNRISLISMSGLKVGDKIKIPGETIGKAIKKLWAAGLIGDIKITITKTEGSSVYLNIDLKERPRLSRYEFVGIAKGQQKTISEKISLIRGKVLNDALLKNTENTIKDFYAEKGFKNAKVKILQKKDTTFGKASNWVYVEVNIDKGNKVKINDIIFEGIADMPEKKLLKKMKKTKEKWFLRIFTPSKFIKEEFLKDKDNLITFYNKNGYRDAQIIKDSVYAFDENTVNIHLKINEGRKFHYRNIIWKGNTVYNAKELSAILAIEKGDVYDPEELNKRLNFSPASTDITSLYMDDGYLFFNIQPVEVKVEEDSIDIEMRIFEGEQATINKVTVKGNTLTSDHVVLRELRTLPGQKFSRSMLIRSRQELSALGYFDPETIDIKPIPNQADGTVDVAYKVEEKSSNQFELSGGWGGFYGFVGTLGLSINNFSLRKTLDWKNWRPIPQGDGQKLQIRFQSNGQLFQNYSFSFTEPWLGGKKPHSLTIAANHSLNRRGLFGAVGGLNDSYMQITGGNISFGRRLKFPDDYFTMINVLSFNRYFLKDFRGFSDFNNGAAINFNFGTTISRNSVDNPTYPRSGSTMTLAMNFTPPYSLITGKVINDDTPPSERYKLLEFHKWMFDSHWYLKLVGNLVLRTSAHMGFMGRYNDKMPYSPFERFILGGSGMTFNSFILGTDIIALRGYRDNSIKPSEFVNGQLSSELGGIAYNKFVCELRYPVSLQPNATIFVLAFAEAGNNWGNFKDYSPFDLRRSVGIGARIFMPAFGMLGFDYGYGLDRIPGVQDANKGQFHFIIGQQIR